ncbi:hypothetical protein [Candidatus Pyrohabitans sp.]
MLDDKMLRNLINLCSGGKFSGVVMFSEEEFDRELERFRVQGFSGALRISFRSNGKLHSEWLIFCDGELKVVVYERDVAALVPELEILDEIKARDGAAEIIEFPDSVRRTVEEILEEYSPAVTQEVKTEEVVETPIEDREALLKKYRIRVNEEEIQFLIEGFRQEEEADHIIITMKESLSKLMGPKMAEKLVYSEMKKLGSEGGIRMDDVERLLNRVYKAIAFQVGKKKAGALIDDIKSMAAIT